MESITDLIISGILLAIPVAIFFAGFFIIFGELFRTVNAIYTLRFADSFIAFSIDNEGYPFTVPPTNISLNDTSELIKAVSVKGGFAYVSYEPVFDAKHNVIIYPELHTYHGIMGGEKIKLFTELASTFGNSYLRYRFSMGDGYDVFMVSIKDGKGFGVFLPRLVENYISQVSYTLKFPSVFTSDFTDFPSPGGGGYSGEIQNGETEIHSFSHEDFSSSGLITTLASKNDVTPPSGFINAPVVYQNGSQAFSPIWFTILTNRKIYEDLTARNYFYNKPRVEVYVEALYITPTDYVKPKDPLSVTLIVSLSRWIPDFKKVNVAKIVINYRYGHYKSVTVEYNCDPASEFFIIPIDWTKSITDSQLKTYKKYNDDISFSATVSYIITYNGKEHIFTTPVRFLIPLK